MYFSDAPRQALPKSSGSCFLYQNTKRTKFIAWKERSVVEKTEIWIIIMSKIRLHKP
jgi:hypothetical protein